MKAVLSHQNSSIKGADSLIIDGELSVFSGTSQQVEAQKLTQLSSNAKPIKVTVLFRFLGASSSLRLYSDKSKLWVVSNFLTTDEIGRRIGYVFFCDEIDKPTFVKRLFMDYCSIAKMKPLTKDCDAIEKALLFEKNKKHYAIIAIFIVIVTLLFVYIN